MSNKDAGVDLERGTAALKEVDKVEEVAVVDPQKAKLVNRFVDAVFVIYVLIFTSMLALAVNISNNWLDPLLTLLTLSPLMIIAFGMIHILRKAAIIVLAAKRPAATDNDLSAKLLDSDT